jgi:methylthioribulose-1-phosphate dehydratase
MMPSPDDTSLARHMVRDARTFYTHGWLMGTSGNLSCRVDAETFLITASGKDKGALGEDDFLRCDLHGQPVGETPHRPSAETLVHCEIYAHFQDVQAIYHVHDPFAALCSARDPEGTMISGVEMIKGLDIWDEDAQVTIPVLPNHAHIPKLASAVHAHLNAAPSTWPVPCVNIARHGVYAWGKSPAEAKRHIETLHYLFHYSWQWGLHTRG